MPPKSALAPETLKKLEALKIPVKPWPEHELLAIMRGHRTLAEVAGVSKEKQFEWAKTGLQFLKDGLKDKALDVFLGLEALDPYDAYVQVCIGTIKLDDEAWEEAEQRFNKALLLNPESVPALYYRGELRLQRLGQPELGIDDLTQVVLKDPQGTQEVSIRARAVLSALKKASAHKDDERKRTTGSVAAPKPAAKPAAAGAPAAAKKPKP